MTWIVLKAPSNLNQPTVMILRVVASRILHSKIETFHFSPPA